jgi:hypothetical protein
MLSWLQSLFCNHEWMVHFVGRYFEGVECIKCSKTDFRSHGQVYANPRGWINDPPSTGSDSQ